VKKLFAMLLSAGLLGFSTGCPNTPTSPRRSESKKDEAKKDEATKGKDDR
jgi:hypothetical protein